MSKVNQEIKAFMELYELSNADGAKALDMNYSSYGNKLFRGSFKLSEVIILAEKAGCKIAVIDENNKPTFIFDH